MAQILISELKPTAKYRVSVRSVSGDTKSEYSPVLEFNTPSVIVDTINKATTIKLGGGALYAGNISGPGVLFDQNGLVGLSSTTACSFYIDSTTGNAYFSGSVIAAAGQIGGFRIGPTSLSATNIVLSSINGLSLGPTSEFTVNTNGNLIATSASITGNINATSGSFTGGIYGASISGGYLNINGNASIGGYINATSGSFTGAINAASVYGGYLNINGNASIGGYINATSGSFTGAINAASMYGGYLNVNGNASISGYILATSGSFTAGLYASAGTIGGWNIDRTTLYSGTGNNTVALSTNGTPKIYAGLGNHGDINTGFYLDASARFSLGNQLIFNPAKGITSASTFNISFTLNSTSVSLNNSSSFIQANMIVTSSALPVSTYVVSAAVGNPATIIFNSSALFTGTTSATFQMDDFAELTIAGTIRGKVENVQSVPGPKLFSIFRSATIDTTASVVSFTTDGHAFLKDERIIFDGISSGAGNGLSALNYTASAGNAFLVQTASNSINFSISYGGYGTAGLTSGTVTASGNSSIQELTLGLHPSEGIGTTASHTSGVGVRLDKYNWWLTNNQFRVGTSGNYFRWNGSQFTIQGGGSKQLLLQVADRDANNLISIVNTGNTATYNNANTPFYVDGSGQFSLGRRLTWDPVGEVLTVRGSGSFTGGLYSASLFGGILNINNRFIIDNNGNASVAGYIVADSGSFNGGLYASVGNIGNWNITTSGLNNGSVGFFASSTYNPAEVAIFAGSAINNRSTAPFRVTYSGNLVAQNASITGNIVANSGSFTGTIYAQSGSFTGIISSTASILGGVIRTDSAQHIRIDGPRNAIYFSDPTGTSYPAYIKPLSLISTEGVQMGYNATNVDNYISSYAQFNYLYSFMSGKVAVIANGQGVNSFLAQEYNGFSSSTASIARFGKSYLSPALITEYFAGILYQDTGTKFVRFYTDPGYELRLDTSSAANAIRIGSNNGPDVYIANNNAQAVYSRGINSSNITGAGTRAVNSDNTTYQLGTNTSTRRVKQQISTFEWDIDTMLSLEPKKYKFDWDVDKNGENAKWNYGFIAEEAEDLGLEWLIERDKDGLVDYFAYERMPVVLHSIIRQQQEQIKYLEQRIAALENK